MESKLPGREEERGGLKGFTWAVGKRVEVVKQGQQSWNKEMAAPVEWLGVAVRTAHV